jgi:hypothetical protein
MKGKATNSNNAGTLQRHCKEWSKDVERGEWAMRILLCFVLLSRALLNRSLFSRVSETTRAA